MTAVTEVVTEFRPCLILAHADPAYSAQVVRAFRRHGWDVYPAQTGPQVRRLARMMQPELVVLQAELPGESGWLTCDKLTGELPTIKVVLVADDLAPRLTDFADFVGADALVRRREGAAALLARIREHAIR